jgi:formamidopyrimidine-DNA glycosylase
VPELPEVETVKRGLTKRIVGAKIIDVVYDAPRMLLPNPKTVLAAVVGTKIVKIERRAKLILIYLSNGNILTIHLKLTGRLIVRHKKFPADEWQHVVFKFDDNSELRFCDLRKFGFARLVIDEKELEEILSEFGPEPLTSEFTKEKLGEILGKSARPLKLTLMDQAKISGVGNIYANEALFWAGIHPETKTDSLSKGQVERLHKAISKVLKEGIKYKGTTESDRAYRDIEGNPGHFQEHLAVYGKEGEKCVKCGTPIKRIKLGGRGTFFCPKCQFK